MYKYYIYRNNATYTATRMSVHPDKTSINRTGNNRDSDATIYGRDLSLRRTKHGQSYRLQQHCLTDPHRWPIYRQSFLQNPSHWWPGTCTGPGPPLWFDQYGGSHLRSISQCLRMVEDGFSPQDAAKATRIGVCDIDFFYLIHMTEHVHPCTMLWWGVGCLQRDSEESASCSRWRCNRSNYEAAPEAPKLEGKAHTPWNNKKKTTFQVFLFVQKHNNNQ